MLFSIVIPTYNRARLVNRAVSSCLRSPTGDYDVIVVDDCSQDDTLSVLAQETDPRVRVIAKPVNEGVCAARGTGTRASKAQWLCFLDSDDEFDGGAIELIAKKLKEQPSDVMALFFRRNHVGGHAGGLATPVKVPAYGGLDYTGYIRMLNGNYPEDCDVFYCARRQTFDTLPWPRTHAPEIIYHLDFARLFAMSITPEAPYLMHSDADDRLTKPASQKPGFFDRDAEKLDSYRQLVARHAAALTEFGPAIYRDTLSKKLSLEIRAGKRLDATRTMMALARAGGVTSRTLFVYVTGMLSVKAFYYFKSLKGRKA